MPEEVGIHTVNDSNEKEHQNLTNVDSQPLIEEVQLQIHNLNEAFSSQNEEIIYTKTVQPVNEKEIAASNVLLNVPESHIEEVPLQRKKRYAIFYR